MRRRHHEEKEVDLAALVDIFSNMLFFLLTTVSFLQLKTLNASVPALSSGAVSTGKSVDVSVEVRATGLILKATGEAADAKVGKVNVSAEIPRKGDGTLDGDELTRQLWALKQKTPETKNILIFPEAGVPFGDIVATMDASREMKSIIKGAPRVPLFTRPVLSELVTGDETPRGN